MGAIETGITAGPKARFWVHCVTHEPCAPQAAKPRLLYQVWESCLLSEIGADVLVQPLVWEFLLGCLESHLILLALATDTLLASLRILLSVHAQVSRGSV